MGKRIFAIALAAVTCAFVACKEDPKPQVDASTVDMSTIDAPAICGASTVSYLGECTDTAECGTCTCQPFAHRSICTPTCSGPADCPAPSGGCAGGYCRP